MATRAFALILDLLFNAVVVGATVAMIMIALTAYAASNKSVGIELLVAVALIQVVYMIVFFHLLGSGRTLGKSVVGVRVGTKRDGKKPGLIIMLVRETLGKMVSGMLFSLGYFWAIFDRDGQGWHDKMVGSIVLHQKEQERYGKALVTACTGILMVLLGGAGFLAYQFHQHPQENSPTQIDSASTPQIVPISTADTESTEDKPSPAAPMQEMDTISQTPASSQDESPLPDVDGGRYWACFPAESGFSGCGVIIVNPKTGLFAGVIFEDKDSLARNLQDDGSLNRDAKFMCGIDGTMKAGAGASGYDLHYEILTPPTSKSFDAPSGARFTLGGELVMGGPNEPQLIWHKLPDHGALAAISDPLQHTDVANGNMNALSKAAADEDNNFTGKSESDIVAAFGAPTSVSLSRDRKLMNYPHMIVTMQNGAVIAIERF